MTRMLRWLCLSCLSLVAAVPALGVEELPAVSHDGLELRKGKVAKVVYVRPDVDFSRYQRIAILEPAVAFRKDWKRDQERSGKRIAQEKMDEIRAGLAAEFMKIFTDELQNKGGYEIVTTGGDDVLVLRPAIIDLDITAPDTMTAGRGYTLSESAGAMTLYLELFDSVTSQILARAIDRETSRGMGRIQWQNSVTNKAEADRILRRWASALRAALDEVHRKNQAQ